MYANVSESTLKIGLHLHKLWPKNKGAVFLEHVPSCIQIKYTGVLLNGVTEINDILSSESQLAKYYKPPWDGTFIYINLVITSCAAASSQSCTIAETWLLTS